MDLLDAGIRLIQALQALGDWLAVPMQAISFLGSEEFFLIVAPAIYWCVDARLGIRLGLFLLLSASLNYTFKMAWHAPRPYWYTTQVHALASESSFGIPSGHAQTSVLIWETLAGYFRRNWAWSVGLLVIILIGISRMFLGVHFPTDVIAGWLIGAALLWALSALWEPAAEWARKRPLWGQIGAGLAVSLLLILATVLARLAVGDWQMPAEWVENARIAFPEGEPIEPLAISSAFTSAGAFFGMAAGLALIQRRGGYQPGGSAWQRLACLAIGLVVNLILWRGLGLVFPQGETIVAFAFRFLRYTLVGLWVAWLAPLVFTRLGLVKSYLGNQEL